MEMNSMKPCFSVIIPTYNRSQELKRAIESVRSQSLSDFEILVMDDGSTDDTREVVEAFNDPRIIYEWEKNFGGPARPRNRGIAKAKGDWICFLDADDVWLPNKLQVCYQYLDESVDLIYHDLQIIGAPSSFFRRNIRSTRQLKKPVLMDLLVNDNAISNSSSVVRKILFDRIGKIDENIEMIASEDYNTWLRIASITDKFLYIPKALGLYAVNDTNISSRDMSGSVECARKNFMHLLSDSENKKFMHKVKYLTGRRAFVTHNHKKAKNNLIYAFKYGGILIRLKSLYMLAIISVKYSDV